MRQLGCATGVAAMTALLQAKIHINIAAMSDRSVIAGRTPPDLFEAATFGAYKGCFRTMAIVTALMIPGIFLFRVARRDPAIPSVV